MGERRTTTYLISQMAAREGGMSAFEAHYIADFRCGAERDCHRQVEAGFDWRGHRRRGRLKRGVPLEGGES